MSSIDERAIREQLEQAVAPLDPVAPALDALRARGVRRRRMQYAFGAGLAAAAATVVAVVLVVAPGGGPDQVNIATAPPADSLSAYAASQHGNHVAGPIESGTGFYGAFAVKKGIQVVHYVDDSWQPAGAVITKYGPGQWVMRLSGAGAVIPGSASFQMRYRGGDVSYFGGVLSNAGGTWRAAKFARCNLKKVSCYYPGEVQPYGHVVNGVFTSIHNDCTPSCAGGTDYRFTWRWDPAAQRFAVATQQALPE